MQINIKRLFLLFVLATGLLQSCRKDDEVLPPTTTPVTPGSSGVVAGFFLLNEGNMGTNKASLDYFDYATGNYSRNIYGSRNPDIVKELGDVGNDIQIYGDKLYAVINYSNFIEVMDVHTAKHIATIPIPNCRYIVFDKGFAYVSSYAGPVELDPNSRRGYVAKIDTASLTVLDTCVVGYQPEQMVVRDNKLYVANSGGYRVPNYDNTVSVIDLGAFKEEKKIQVAINLLNMAVDSHGDIYVGSRGDYGDTPSNIYVIDKDDKVSAPLGVAVNSMTIAGDSLYIISSAWSNVEASNTISYSIVNTESKKVVADKFITDGTEAKITLLFGIAVNPATKEILVTDVGNYVEPGRLYCFSPEGKLKWDIETGDIPAHIAFTHIQLREAN